MVDTGVQAELQNSIRQAQDQLMEMGSLIGRLPQGSERKQLKEMCSKAGNLLSEAQERAEIIL